MHRPADGRQKARSGLRSELGTLSVNGKIGPRDIVLADEVVTRTVISGVA